MQIMASGIGSSSRPDKLPSFSHARASQLTTLRLPLEKPAGFLRICGRDRSSAEQRLSGLAAACRGAGSLFAPQTPGGAPVCSRHQATTFGAQIVTGVRCCLSLSWLALLILS